VARAFHVKRVWGVRASPIGTHLELLSRNVERFRGGLVFKAHRLVNHSTLGLRVIKKKKHLEDSLRTTLLLAVAWLTPCSSPP
jgi:hypothetical protein